MLKKGKTAEKGGKKEKKLTGKRHAGRKSRGGIPGIGWWH